MANQPLHYSRLTQLLPAKGGCGGEGLYETEPRYPCEAVPRDLE